MELEVKIEIIAKNIGVAFRELAKLYFLTLSSVYTGIALWYYINIVYCMFYALSDLCVTLE